MDGLVKDRDFGDGPLTNERYVWTCAIGGVNPVVIPSGGDGPMRAAVEAAFRHLTGQEAEACFSGWGCEFTERAKAVIQDRLPADDAAGDAAMTEQPKDEATALLREARTELAAYVEDAWPAALREHFPALQAKWRRDMDLCFRIDALLAAREVQP